MAQYEGKWQWWAGSNEEWMTVGPCDTREQVIAEATDDRIGEDLVDGKWILAFHIVEARQDPLRVADWIGADRLLEYAEDNIADSDRVGAENDDGPWFPATDDQEADLIARVKAACDDWQTAHGLKFKSFTFSHTRNGADVVVPHPDPAEAD
ncbi:hypothetical protein [Rhizobium leguminosarum]|uniref:hypothetical protein n=1 Tax=Rhizobium leguminosarum TaxID=384 RepID=UPI0015DAC8CF|nr:hypothetical protein [Rhizobium leguminosarum]NZD50518.1 hypothetical protein [Rhizobium leguminosarum]